MLLFAREQQIRSPICRVETPMAGTVLQGSVSVSHEALRRKLIATLETLDAHRVVRFEQFSIEDTLTLAETFVIHLELDNRLLVLVLTARLLIETILRLAYLSWIAGLRSQQQCADQPLGVGLSDQTARRCVMRQDRGVLEFLQLIAGAARAVDLQLVAHLIDLRQREVLQHRVQYLR